MKTDLKKQKEKKHKETPLKILFESKSLQYIQMCFYYSMK